jgi:hypothetical protein
MFSRKKSSVVAAVLAAGFLAVAPGCDWFQSSDPGSRQSPFLSSLSVSPSSVLCSQTFAVSFRYDDPQGDIASVRMTFRLSGETDVREEHPLWPESNSRSGTVKFEDLSFSCDSKGGSWLITVQTEDLRGHTSNELEGVIRLDAAG